MARKPRNTYLRGDTYWGRIKVAGVQYRCSLRTGDPREAARRFKAWRLKLERATLGDEESPSFKEAVIRWAKEVLPGAVKPSVGKRYLSSIAQLDAVFGDLRMDQISNVTVAAYVSARSGQATNATIRRDLTALSRLLAACVAWGWRQDNPARIYDRSIVREQRDPISPPDPAAFALVLANVPPAMAKVLQLLDQSGMRSTEGVRLEARDVDATRMQVRLMKTKTNRPRAIAWVTPGGNLTPLLASIPAAGPLFPAETGGAYRNFSANFGQAVRRLIEAEKLHGRQFQRFRVHDLRHGFAIRWLKAGGDIYALSRHLGHSSVKTTEGYLAYLTVEERARVAQNGTQRADE